MVRPDTKWIWTSFVLISYFYSCIPTHKSKDRLMFYQTERGNSENFSEQGFYYSKGKWSENTDFYFVRFFNTDGMYVSYLIEDCNSANFENKLQQKIINKAIPNTWGAYVMDSDTLRLQTVPYGSKYNLFTTIPLTEHVFVIDDQKLTYQYSFMAKGPRKIERFIAPNNESITYKKASYFPDFTALNLE